MKLIFIILIFPLILSACNSSPTAQLSPTITSAPTSKEELYSLPIADFKNRISKKNFGTYVTTQNSPVSPEKFNGYHTGVDVEYEDIDVDVPIFAIADGQVIYSGYVNGYGGFVAIHHQNIISTYGHLRPTSLIKNNTLIKKGDQIGVLGTGFTTETDNERKHLHFAILKGQKLDFRGYVNNQEDLSLWHNPLLFDF